LLGVFAKVVLGQAVKTRLQSQLSRQEAECFHTACLADILETATSFDVPLTLFLQGTEKRGAVRDLRLRLEDAGFPASQWESLSIQPQVGADLGERLENGVAWMLTPTAPQPCLILGSDHPSLPASAIRDGLERLRGNALPDSPSSESGTALAPDLVLGPTPDGGYWGIGCVRPIPGILRQIHWSTPRVLLETQQRAKERGMRVALLQPWSDVDRPEDLEVLARQITRLRSQGETRTARHVERFLRQRGRLLP
jgi:glycosyltransferase A (GT-A) superfamily protein (DUF2064 family)